MADSRNASPSPAAALPSGPRPGEDHAPSVPSPLNPDAPTPRTGASGRAAAKPVVREQREKKDSLKKRESVAAATRSPTNDAFAPGVTAGAGAGAAAGGARPSKKQKVGKETGIAAPWRFYGIGRPERWHYDAPRQMVFSGEDKGLFTPDRKTELVRPVDHYCTNTRTFRYKLAVADPLFHHTQNYRQSEVAPYNAHMSLEDSDKNIYFDKTHRIITNQKGWRSSRANVVAREGSLYYEVKVLEGIPAATPIGFRETEAAPHIRIGWGRREAPLDAPAGYDGFSYAITDTRFDTVHRSRLGKFLAPPTKTKSRKKPDPSAADDQPPLEPLRVGEVIGLLLTLPPLSLHRKVVAGTWNPAVDLSAAADPTAPAPDIVRDRIPAAVRGNVFFEQTDYQPTKAVTQYSDRAPVNPLRPNATHADVPLRALPASSLRVFRNGKPVGTAFEGLLAFLPPASQGGGSAPERQSFDDGSLGYYPLVSVFTGGVAEVNLGPDFWCPPAELELTKGGEGDVEMEEAEARVGASAATVEVMKPRAVSERYNEQIAEDVVYDIIDEAAYFAQDGGDEYVAGYDELVGSRIARASGIA